MKSRLNQKFHKAFLFAALLFCVFNNVQAQEGYLSNEDRVLELLKRSQNFLEEGDRTSAFLAMTKAQQASELLNNDSLFFKTTIEVANFFILKNEVFKAKRQFDKIEPGPKYSSADNCRYFHRLAFYYNHRGSLDTARDVSLTALNIATENKINGVQNTIFNELGNIYEKKRYWDSSLYYYDKSVMLFDTNSVDYANAYFNKARTYYQFKSFDSAIYHLSFIYERIRDTDWYQIKAPVLNYLSLSYGELGDSLKRYKYDALGKAESIESMNQMSNSQLLKLETEYETKEKEAALGQQKIELESGEKERTNLFYLICGLGVVLILIFYFFIAIRRKNKRLNKLLEENEFLVGEANHRIKNNLQIIVSLVAREIYKEDNEEIDALRNIGSKIESIATLHQQLYINEEKSEINLNDYMESLVESLEPIYAAKGIELEMKVQKSLDYNVTKSMYIGLLFNELVINSIKHAFEGKPDSKQIKLSVTREGEKILFEYSDNGIGLAKESKPKLIDMLCRQIKSKYEIQNSDGFNFKTLI